MATPADAQILVKFTTKLPSELRVNDTPMAVPTSVKRFGLSRIINTLLSLDPVRPFDFLVHGELLRFSLEKHLLDHGLSAEALLEIEYVPAVAPPEQKHAAPHDDWVSAVAEVPGGVIVSGSYDGIARLWNGDAECTSSFVAHKGGVTAVASVASSSGQGALVLTAGKDHLVKLWLVSGEGGAAPTSQLVASCAGHSDAVEGVAVSPAGDLAASSAWDGTINLWRTGDSLLNSMEEDDAAAGPGSVGETAAAASKRRKVGSTAAAPAAAGGTSRKAVEVAPTSTLRGHLHCVSSVSWPESRSLYSGGWDHSVRRWDPEVGVNTDTYNGSKAVLCVAAPSATSGGGGGGALVAFGGADRSLRLWDVRGRGEGDAIAVRSLAPHGGWVVAVAWCPDSAHHLVTASHDHSLKLWDVRTTVPLATLAQHTDKVLCTAWLKKSKGQAGASGTLGRLVSGGADCSMRVWGAPDGVAEV